MMEIKVKKNHTPRPPLSEKFRYMYDFVPEKTFISTEDTFLWENRHVIDS